MVPRGRFLLTLGSSKGTRGGRFSSRDRGVSPPAGFDPPRQKPMRIGKAFAAIGLGAALLVVASVASAHPPADDFINPQDPGPRLTLMPFIGPGFRANYDHRFKIEKDM